jgi:hypothetical protein
VVYKWTGFRHDTDYFTSWALSVTEPPRFPLLKGREVTEKLNSSLKE